MRLQSELPRDHEEKRTVMPTKLQAHVSFEASGNSDQPNGGEHNDDQHDEARNSTYGPKELARSSQHVKLLA